MGFPSGSVGKNLPAMQETWVQSLGQKGPLEKVMATHSSILGLEIPWTEESVAMATVHGVAGGEHYLATEPHNYLVSFLKLSGISFIH